MDDTLETELKLDHELTELIEDSELEEYLKELSDDEELDSVDSLFPPELPLLKDFELDDEDPDDTVLREDFQNVLELDEPELNDDADDKLLKLEKVDSLQLLLLLDDELLE